MATSATARPKNDSLNGNGRGRGSAALDAEISVDDSIKANITDNAPINIILADTDLRIIYMNEASRRTLKTIENLLPFRVDEIVGKSVDEFHENPSYQRGILRNYKDLPRQAQIKLGDQILDLLVSATYDAEGNYTGPMVTWSVITEKVEFERRNADVTNQLAAIDRNQAVIEFQMDGTIVRANENFLRTVGYSMDEIKGQHHRMFCEDSYTRSPEYKEFWARLNRGEYNAGEFKRIGKGSKEVWIQASYNAIADVNGKLVKVVKFASDITEAVKARQRQAELEELEKKAQEELKRNVDELLRVVDAASKGDLTKEITISGTDAVGQLAGGLSKMFTDLRDIIGQIVESGAQFSEGARVIAESSQALASGALTQSAAVEEVSASVDQLTKQIEGVKGSANQANELAQSTSKLAQDGGDAVGKSVEAMDLIKKSSEQISEIIQVISEIASQTNLLALNAAIEAARAGEHGLGFAVVADEVRKLAERSSSAAKEISSLIRESTKRVDAGAELSSQTGDALRRIVEGVASTAAKISEIADATAEQATSAQEVSQAVQEIGKVTEQAAASSEELASSSEELGAQSAVLKETVARFKV